ncbi:hypothetical protein TNCV_4105721 [Trichonephila clavipes]|nr:hypothetical protein TNCV_4105721 [Trichonephila clavipes]
MGSRLRKLKALWGKKKLSDGKTIGGKGRLTDAIISKLTTFYGNAIRANSHNVNEMRQAVWAVLCYLVHLLTPAVGVERSINTCYRGWLVPTPLEIHHVEHAGQGTEIPFPP